MPVDLSVINVVDIEATCWDGPEPLGQRSEIIEIGVIELHVKSGIVGAGRSLLVKPLRSQVSPFCTRLTGHTQEELDRYGCPYGEATKYLIDVCRSFDRVWASWGDYDRTMFQSPMYSQYPFGKRHINVATLFALTFQLDREPCVAEALQGIGLAFEGREHNGLDDARNIARLLRHLLGGTRGPV